MNETLIVIGLIALLATIEHYRAPKCGWCRWRHTGRCIYNPRAGRVFANVNDSRFDYEDPNK